MIDSVVVRAATIGSAVVRGSEGDSEADVTEHRLAQTWVGKSLEAARQLRVGYGGHGRDTVRAMQV